MTISWRFQNGRFAGIANSMAALEFSDVVMGRVRMLDTTSVASPRDGYSADLAAGLQTSGDPASGSGFTLSFGKASGSPQFTLDLVGTVDATREALLLTPQITNDGPATDVVHYLALQFKLKPIGDAADCMVMIPGPQSQVYPWEQLGADNGYSHPGLIDKGFGSNPSDEPSSELSITTSASFVQWIYVWNEDSWQGALFRTTDIVGQGKILRVDRDSSTNELLITVLFVPPDNSTGCQSHDFGYGLEIRPMFGEDWDALIDVRDAQLDEGHPFDALGTLRDRVATNDYDAWDIFAFFAVAIADDTTGFDYTKFSSMITDLLAFFEDDLDPAEVLGTIYDVQNGILGEHEPSVPYQTGAATAVSAIHAMGVKVGLYTVPINPSIWDGTYGLPPGSGIATDNLALDRDSAALTTGNALDAKWMSPDWLSDTNTDALFDLNIAQHTTALGAADFSAAYMDAHNAFLNSANDNPGLTANDRGIGSLTYYPKIRAGAAIMKTALTNAGVTNPIVYTEHPNEMTIGWYDLFFDNTIGPATEAHGLPLVTAKCSQPTIMWSRWSRMTHFDGFTAGPEDGYFDAYAVSGYASFHEIFNSLESFKWHLGHVVSFLRYFLLYGDTWYFKSGYSAAYAAWGESIRDMFFRQKELGRFIDTSQRMRETPSSAVRRMRRAIKANDATVMLVPENKCHSSVWWDEPTGKAWIKLKNWSLPGHNPEAILYRDVLTTAHYAFLTGTRRRCTLLNKTTGARTVLPGYDGSGTYQPSVMVNAGQTLIIEMEETMDYYVDDGIGLDTNDGLTAATAFKTLGKVATVWGTGDTIHVAGGATYALAATLAIPDGVTIEQTDPGETDKPIISAGGGAFAVITIQDVAATLRSIWIAGAGSGNHGIAMIGAVDGTLFEGCVSLLNAGAGIHADATTTGTVTINSCGSVQNGGMGYDINGAVVIAGDGILSQSNTGNGFGFSDTSVFNGSSVICYADIGVGILFDGTGTHTLGDVQILNVVGYPVSITAACTVTMNRVAADQAAARGFSVVGGTLNIRNSYLLIHSGSATGGGGLYLGAGGSVTFLNMVIVNFSDDAIPNIYTAPTATSITMFNLISIAEGTNSVHVDGNAATALVDNNTYYPDGAAKFASSSVAFTANFATWQAAAAPIDANSQVADPLLRAPADDLPNLSAVRLRPGSPCIGFGANLQAFFTDSATGAKRPTSGAWDAGAFVGTKAPALQASGIGMDIMEELV